MRNSFDELEQLNDLFNRGILSEEEYKNEKERILSREGSNATNKLFGLNENTYCMLIHLSVFTGFIHFAFAFIAPFVLWILNKDYFESVNSHGKVVINWLLSLITYIAILMISMFPLHLFTHHSFNFSFDLSGPFSFSTRFLPMLILMILNLAFIINGALKANSGILWRYPLCIRFLR